MGKIDLKVIRRFIMYYPYCTIEDRIEVVHTPLNQEGMTVVHFEEPDARFGLKTLDCTIPNYRIVSCVGFSEKEVSSLVEFCRNNASLLLVCAKEGGISNAEFI